ncbi:hypothetical protein LCGC14_0344680 [marine sediment metagenome]|uniref:Uncharacterized protein n=1 Tax=marine sediment metagenome TaxID=412755 RepID=A0A0F9TVK4_9ZZZZ
MEVESVICIALWIGFLFGFLAGFVYARTGNCK